MLTIKSVKNYEPLLLHAKPNIILFSVQLFINKTLRSFYKKVDYQIHIISYQL